ncbi:unnamed protein product, partial [Musa textilis]
TEPTIPCDVIPACGHVSAAPPANMSAASASAVAAAASPINHTLRAASVPPPSTPPLLAAQKSAFHGSSLLEHKRNCSLAGMKRNGAVGGRRGLVVRARTAGASKNIEVEVDKPLGLTLGQKPGGGVVITAVDSGGNAAKAGLKSGDQVLYTSSFFGDELWPADKLGFTKTAIQAKPDSVYFVVSRGAEVDVKRLTKRPAPPRFGRSLTESQKASELFHLRLSSCIECSDLFM